MTDRPPLRNGVVYVVDISRSDHTSHTYCDQCFAAIPAFLRRQVSEFTVAAVKAMRHTDFDQCEGCGWEFVDRSVRPMG